MLPGVILMPGVGSIYIIRADLPHEGLADDIGHLRLFAHIYPQSRGEFFRQPNAVYTLASGSGGDPLAQIRRFCGPLGGDPCQLAPYTVELPDSLRLVMSRLAPLDAPTDHIYRVQHPVCTGDFVQCDHCLRWFDELATDHKDPLSPYKHGLDKKNRNRCDAPA